MDFELNQDQNIFYESVRKFASNELADDAVARANSDGYPWDVAKKFGEMGLLGNAPRNATITAADDTKLLELTKADLAELSEEHPGLFKELELSVSNRTSD